LEPDLVQKKAVRDGFAWWCASAATAEADAMTTAITMIVFMLLPTQP
jgi:hypothetical protein